MKEQWRRTKYWIRKSRFRKTSLKKSQIAEFSLSLAQLIVKDDLELAEYHTCLMKNEEGPIPNNIVKWFLFFNEAYSSAIKNKTIDYG